MKAELAQEAIQTLIETMIEDVNALEEDVVTAHADITDQRRNGAIGALGAMDVTLERLAATLSAARAIHRAAG